MINEPAVDYLIDKLGHEGQPASRYELCVVVAKRARQLIERNAINNINENPGKLKEIALACEEIEDGKIKSVKD
ncbi:MAG: DNA-directed RNA polymerase subunit omega [Clostridia bacterium]|nr:DNA-directed RNA polymerase subunit omega [Clostridia bacterium]MDE7256347.1 DNA-directed RNA polymerase subunit omega [Clostridia bacterium]